MKNKKYYAPLITQSIRILHRSNIIPSEETKELIDELFLNMNRLKPCSENGKRKIWICLDRGPIDAFGNYKESLEIGDVDSYEEFERWWLEEYPDEKNWYLVETIEDNGHRLIVVGNRVVFRYGPEDYSDFYDFSDFISCLIYAVKESIRKVEDGTYHKMINSKLPYCHRTGTLLREKYWEIFPEEKEDLLKELSESEIKEFVEIIKKDLTTKFDCHIPNFTANHFFQFCALGYQANNYKDLEGKTWKEQYLRHADGRCEGLDKINPDSPKAFIDWYNDCRRLAGHPWEVCRGGNSTHISLYVERDQKGFYLVLSGSSYGRYIETIKFFLALRKAGIPVLLHNAQMLSLRVQGKDKIGIVPRDIMPFYCSSLFPEENINDFLHLPKKHQERFIQVIDWQPLEPAELNTLD